MWPCVICSKKAGFTGAVITLYYSCKRLDLVQWIMVPPNAVTLEQPGQAAKKGWGEKRG